MVGLVTFCFGAAPALAQNKPDSVSPAATLPSVTATPSDFSDEPTLEAWGWSVAHEQEVSQTELSVAELTAFQKGMATALKGGPSGNDMQRLTPDIERLSLARREKFWRSLEESNLAAGRAFLKNLPLQGTGEGAGGLHYEIVKLGSGPFPQPEQTVTVHYVGRLIDGSDFTELGPYDLVLVKNRLLPGLFEGIRKIKKGGIIRLNIPPTTPGSAETRPGVPRGSLTVYEVQLLDIKATAPDDLANSLLPPAPELPPPAPSGASDEQIIEAWGWSTVRKLGTVDYGLSEKEIMAFLRGVAAAIKGEPIGDEEAKIHPMVERFVCGRRDSARLALREKRLAAMNAVFTELKKNPQIVALADGLRYEILKPGSGPAPKTGQIVVVDYTGRLMDGTIFDQTYNEPLQVEVGSVIPGLNEGFQLIGKGGRIKLYVPPSLGYGDENISGVVSRIPASSLLTYEIELLDIKDAVPESAGTK